MTNRVVFQHKYTRRRDYMYAYQRHDVLRSRRLYQAQFEAKASLKRQIRYLEKCEKTEMGVFESNKKIFMQTMKERMEQANKTRQLMTIEIDKIFSKKATTPKRQEITLPTASNWSKLTSDLPALMQKLTSVPARVRYGVNNDTGNLSDSSCSSDSTEPRRTRKLYPRNERRKSQWPVVLALATSLGASMCNSVTAAQVEQLNKRRERLNALKRVAKTTQAVITATKQYVRLPSETGEKCIIYESSESDEDSDSEYEESESETLFENVDSNNKDAVSIIDVYNRELDKANTSSVKTASARSEVYTQTASSEAAIPSNSKDKHLFKRQTQKELTLPNVDANATSANDTKVNSSKPVYLTTDNLPAETLKVTQSDSISKAYISPDTTVNKASRDSQRNRSRDMHRLSEKLTIKAKMAFPTLHAMPAPKLDIELKAVRPSTGGRLILTDEEREEHLTGFRKARIMRLNHEKVTSRFLGRKVLQFRTPSKLLLRDETILTSPKPVNRRWDYSEATMYL